MGIINTIKQKIKQCIGDSYWDEVFWIALVVLVGLGSFSLGMLHERASQLGAYPLRITHNEHIEKSIEQYQSDQQTGSFFASKNGTKVYTAECKAGDRIALENRIFFQTLEQAEALGYGVSNQCEK